MSVKRYRQNPPMHNMNQRKDFQELYLTCYGAGSEVGRSCILVELSGKRILLDCGANVVANKEDDLTPIFPGDQIEVDLVLISHIHTDHLASIPYLTEVLNVTAPIYLTKAAYELAPIMLDDFIKVSVFKKYNKQQLERCISKLGYVEFGQRRELCEGIWVTPYPAGHLLGATAFYVSSHGKSFLYTGDFSGSADHHLPGYQIPRLFPDLLITESTYGNKTREPIYKREKSFVQQVYNCVNSGGRVLIPVFAVGRLQEICLMLNDFWERMDCDKPIYYKSKMGERATKVYKKCIRWMNPTIKTGFYDYNKKTLEFSIVEAFDEKKHNSELPCVMVATSGMLSTGPAYEFFIKKKWYNDPKNLILFPGYCGEGTLGRAILERPEDNHIVMDNRGEKLDFILKCKVGRVSFSAHADQFEIVNMCHRVHPRSVVTVHGDRDAVKTLATKIKTDLKIPAHVATNCKPIDLGKADMQIISIDKDCFKANQFEFEGAVAATPDHSSRRIISLEKASSENNCTVANVKLERRVNTCASFDEIIKLLKEMKLISEKAEFGVGQDILTSSFNIKFTKKGLLIQYDVHNKSTVNIFCCLIARVNNKTEKNTED